jgi:hypothetical protein
MMTQTWKDAYRELFAYLAKYRGIRDAIGPVPDHAMTQLLSQWPRTRGADVLAIAAVVEPALNTAPLEAGWDGIERRWRRRTSELTDAALHDPDREYRYNQTFWSTLAAIAAYLASVDAPVPYASWQALLAEFAPEPSSPDGSHALDDGLHLVSFRYDELWHAQKAALAIRRGSDVRDAPVGFLGDPIAIPRTLNADIVQLATYWTHALAELDEKRRALEADPDESHPLRASGLDGEIQRWRAALADVDHYATHGDPRARYPKNEAFWRASGSVSATLAAADETPAVFDMMLEPVTAQSGFAPRNASYPGAGTFEARWDMQHDGAIEAHGFDVRDPAPGRAGRPMKVPRTHNVEIAELAEDWSAAWKKLEGRRGVLGSIPGEELGLDTLKKRWQQVMNDVGELAEHGPSDDVYPKNHEFWRETFELAQTLDLYNEVPSRFEIMFDTAKSLPDRLANVVGQVAHAVGDIAHKAGEGVSAGLGKPILIGGGVILGGILLWRWTRPRRRAAEAA